MRRSTAKVMTALALAMGACVWSGAAGAADLNVNLPTVSVQPGGTAVIELDALPSPAGLGIQAIEYRLVLGSSVVQSAQVLNDGFLWTWGAPFVNANPDFVAAAAAGVSTVTSSGVRLSSVQVTVHPSVLPGTDLPLTFSKLLFNEGTPSAAWTAGVLQVRGAPTGVGEPPAAGGGLAPPLPNPAASEVRLGFAFVGTVAGAPPSRLEIFDPLGRRVRVWLALDAAAGRGEVRWDLRDEGGRPVANGLYLARLGAGARSWTRRVAVLR